MAETNLPRIPQEIADTFVMLNVEKAKACSDLLLRLFDDQLPLEHEDSKRWVEHMALIELANTLQHIEAAFVEYATTAGVPA